MRKILLLSVFVFSIATISAQPSATPLGMNLSRLYSYSSEIPFVDVFKQSEDWTSTNAIGGPPTSVNVPLDLNGYPLEIPYDNGSNPPQIVSTIMLDIADGRYPIGTYTLIFEGDGEIILNGDASGTFNQNSGTGTYTFSISSPSANGIQLTINRSDVNDHVKNIRVIMPGHETTYLSAPFYPDFLDKLQGFKVIRFMDWTRTNGAWWTSWSQRNLPTYRTHAVSGGVPYEWAIALCNELNTDMWINIPHQVDDNYITQLARLIRDSINSNLKVYIEYSNELWNSGFSQRNWAINQGFALGLGPSGNGQTGRRFTAKRCAEIFKIFENEFGIEKTRLVKLLAGQATNTTVATQLLAAFALPSYNSVPVNPNGIQANAFAIAPYFGGGVADAIGDAGLINSVTIQEILDSAEADMLHPLKLAAFQQHKNMAEQNNMALIAYEGGQSLRANDPSYQSNTTLTQKLIDANRNNRMYDIYRTYLDNWFNNLCGGVFCHFQYARVPNQFGSWGAVEYPAQSISTAPKYRALRSVIDTPQVLSANFSHVVNGLNVSFTNLSTHANTYSWNFGDGSPPDITSNSAHTYLNPGQYTVTLSAENNCDSIVHKDTIDLTTTGIQNNNTNIEFTITPNPNNGVFELILPSTLIGNLTIEIINALGQIVYLDKLLSVSNSYHKKFDINRFSKGTYIMIVKKNNLQLVKKIVTY